VDAELTKEGAPRNGSVVRNAVGNHRRPADRSDLTSFVKRAQNEQPARAYRIVAVSILSASGQAADRNQRPDAGLARVTPAILKRQLSMACRCGSSSSTSCPSCK